MGKLCYTIQLKWDNIFHPFSFIFLYLKPRQAKRLAVKSHFIFLTIQIFTRFFQRYVMFFFWIVLSFLNFNQMYRTFWSLTATLSDCLDFNIYCNASANFKNVQDVFVSSAIDNHKLLLHYEKF